MKDKEELTQEEKPKTEKTKKPKVDSEKSGRYIALILLLLTLILGVLIQLFSKVGN